MFEIRGQQATDWKDVYEMRTATPGALPYIRPDWVRDELAQPGDRAWPLVAVVQRAEGARVVARVDVQLGWARRAHVAYLAFEQHPDYAGAPGRELLQEAIAVAENWWNKRRLQVTDVLGASECFLTSSTKEAVPVVRLDGREIGSGTHPVCDDILTDWHAWVPDHMDP